MATPRAGLPHPEDESHRDPPRRQFAMTAKDTERAFPAERSLDVPDAIQATQGAELQRSARARLKSAGGGGMTAARNRDR